MPSKRKTSKRKTLSKRELREEFERRSRASKLGWKRRKKGEKKKALLASIRKERIKLKNVGRKPKRKGKRKTKPKITIESLKVELAKEKELRLKAEREIAIDIATRHFVYGETDYLRRDGTIALNPVSGGWRHVAKKQYDFIRSSIKRVIGTDMEFERMNQIAETMNLDVREVYTLWYSP